MTRTLQAFLSLLFLPLRPSLACEVEQADAYQWDQAVKSIDDNDPAIQVVEHCVSNDRKHEDNPNYFFFLLYFFHHVGLVL